MADDLPDSGLKGCDQGDAAAAPDAGVGLLRLAPLLPAATKTPPLNQRAARSRASILDTSTTGINTPCSPQGQQKQQQQPGSSSKNRGVPARLAFGTRIDGPQQQPAGRRASPARLRTSADRSKQGSPAAGARLPSPQRVPAARRAATAAPAATRSASAPRCGAGQAASRFQQHQAAAIAAARSSTPTPLARKSAANALAETRHIARLRRSTDEAGRLVRSPSPAARPLSPTLVRTGGSPAGRLSSEPDRYTRAGAARQSAAGSPGLTVVPKPVLGGLVSRPGAGQATASRDSSGSGQAGKAATSPFLGRVSAGATRAPAGGGGSSSTPPKLLSTSNAGGAGLLALRSQLRNASPAAGAAVGSSSAFLSAAQRVAPVNQAAAAAGDDDWTPPLLPRQHSSTATDAGDPPREGCRQLGGCWDSGSLSQESSLLSVGSGVAAAVRSLALPLERLEQDEQQQQHTSPPKLRRGERSSPKGAAAVCSQLLKQRASSACSSGDSTTAAAGAAAAAHLEALAGPADGVNTPEAQQGAASLNGLVPRLDLTRLNCEAQEQEEQRQQQQSESPGQVLEQRPQRGSADGLPEPQVRRSRCSSAGGGDSLRGPSGDRKQSSHRAAGSRGAQPEEAAAPQQESFYVYESAMPAEETRMYEELRRVLIRSGRDGPRLAAGLRGLWGCYADARRATEAMAFRGHRLLDQVSNEYCSFKRDAEQHMEQLQAERDAYRQQAETALAVRGASMELAARDKQVVELQQQVAVLQDELANTRQALQMAADLHHATQAQREASQVPLMARTIAESATTKILFQQSLQQQEQLQAQAKELRDIKAALLMACETLTKTTDWQDPQGHVRSEVLTAESLDVLEAVIDNVLAWREEGEVDGLPAAPTVCIQELAPVACD